MSTEVNEHVIPDDRLNKYVHDIAKNCELTNPKFTVERASKVGDNFVGVVYRATVEGEKNGEVKTVSTILKCSPHDDVRKVISTWSMMFDREIFFYKEILAAFNDLAKEFSVPMQRYAKFYGADQQNDSQIIILEDLCKKGYIMRSNKTLDYAHVSLAVRNLGQLHAYSFALRDKKPEVFAKVKTMKDTIFTEEISEKRKESGYVEKLCSLVDKALSNQDEKYSKAFDTFRNDIHNISLKMVSGEAAEPYAVVTHGDAWTNNFLFKYENDSTEPSHMCFLDFQMSRYASPAIDLLYLLYCSCLPELRKQYFDKLLHEYYESFSENLRQFDCDPETVFPFHVLLEHMKRFGNYAAVMAIFVLHVTVNTSVNNIEDMKDPQSLVKLLWNDSLHQSLIKNTFTELVDRGYL